MGPSDMIVAVAAGGVCLALAAALAAVLARRRGERRAAELLVAAEAGRALGASAGLAADAFDIAILRLEARGCELIAGARALGRVAARLGLTAEAEPATVLQALKGLDPHHARSLEALRATGQGASFTAHGPNGDVVVEGRPAGAWTWLRLTAPEAAARPEREEGRLSVFINAYAMPAWIARADGGVVWANTAWLKGAGAASLTEARAAGLTFDAGADLLVREAAEAGEARRGLRWVAVDGDRRAFMIAAKPLDGGGVGAFAADVTEHQRTREAFERYVAAHDETLDHLADAVAIFDQGKRLVFHNTAFDTLWGLEPSWLDDHPTHGEVLDRLRQRRRLPETADYGRFKAEELARYETLSPAEDDRWSLPDGRTLRVVRQPHPLGGLLLIFSDITDELRLKAQYNAQIQVQQATLDRLTDAVAVFSADGRLRLHNDAFARFWNIPAESLDGADYEQVVEQCLPRLHDMSFWRELKGRVTDPDPAVRAATRGEVLTADRRIVSWQSRPLPDASTLIGFTDVTDTRRLEGALADREAALAEATRLKRDFVGNVSYELRTPLTTIIGYSELLEHAGGALSQRARGHVAAVRQAAGQLARSIDDVLDMAQFDAGEMALDLDDVDVCALLTDAAARWSRQAAQTQATLEVICGDDVGLIRGDHRRLDQVIDHLVENAVRQTPPGQTVTLSARKALGEVQIQVIDRGRGIPFHVQAHIFDRFVGRDRGGPGLGLALVKALIELHGGWVALESEPGAGATFTCHLPKVAMAQSAAPELGF